MQNNFFNADNIRQEINKLDRQIFILSIFRKTKYKKISVELLTLNEEKFSLKQDLLPFNLMQELVVLLDDSIIELKRRQTSLQKVLEQIKIDNYISILNS